jgi:hypothetical protein
MDSFGARIDSSHEAAYHGHGGILTFVLRQLAGVHRPDSELRCDRRAGR